MAPKKLSPYVARSLKDVYLAAAPRTENSLCYDICECYNKYNETQDERDLLNLFNLLEELFDDTVYYSFFQSKYYSDDMLHEMFSWIVAEIIRKYSNIKEKDNLDDTEDDVEDLNYEWEEDDE